VATDLDCGTDLTAALHSYIFFHLAPQLADEFDVSNFAVIISHMDLPGMQGPTGLDVRKENFMFVHSEGVGVRFSTEFGLTADVIHRLSAISAGEPCEGAGSHRGFVGGVAGFSPEINWRVYCELIDVYIILRDEAARDAACTS
jgi:hypothetical protein